MDSKKNEALSPESRGLFDTLRILIPSLPDAVINDYYATDIAFDKNYASREKGAVLSMIKSYKDTTRRYVVYVIEKEVGYFYLLPEQTTQDEALSFWGRPRKEMNFVPQSEEDWNLIASHIVHTADPLRIGKLKFLSDWMVEGVEIGIAPAEQ
jgi:hypothetical protein